MPLDPRGLPITAASPDAAQAFERALQAYLAQRPDTLQHLDAALTRDPDLVAAHALIGFAQLCAARRPLVASAGDRLAAARGALDRHGGTQSERALVAALADWQERGDMHAAADRLDASLAANPRDLLTLRLSHAIRFMLGQAAAMRRSLELALPAWDDDTPGWAFVQGCHAFTLGETGDVAAAERTGRAAVAAEPADLWGAHAVAHALGAQGRPREGIAWIAWLEPQLAHGGPFVRHIVWHRALAHLRLGEPERAMALYLDRIRTAAPDVRDMLNAVSLLWRLQAAGHTPAAPLWHDLADVAAGRTGEHAWVFADIHSVLALAVANRHDDLDRMLASMASHMDGSTQATLLAETGVPLAIAIAEALGGNPARARALLTQTEPRHRSLGGSNAQRDLLRILGEGVAAEGKEAVLFEKKNQKTSTYYFIPGGANERAHPEESLFASFSSEKETLTVLPLPS